MQKKKYLKRRYLKEEAKGQLKAQYWPCLGVQFVLLLFTLGLPRVIGWLIDPAAVAELLKIEFFGVDFGNYLLGYWRTVLFGVPAGVVSIEASYFFLSVFRGKRVGRREFFAGLCGCAGRKAGAYLWRMLFLYLWGGGLVLPLAILLVVTSGSGSTVVVAVLFFASVGAALVLMSVKGLAYSMMPYIIREYPKVTVRKSMRLSIALMKGNKGKLFILFLSFIGWFLLLFAIAYGVGRILPRGADEAVARAEWVTRSSYIVSIGSALYAGPFMAIAQAGFYHNLKRAGLASGAVSQAELEGAD